MPCRLLLASSSRCHPHNYLDHCEEEMRRLFAGVTEVLFIPFARPGGLSHEEYTTGARERFAQIGIGVRGIHQEPDPRSAINKAQGVFIGGGNTFVLLNDLYQFDLIRPLQERIAGGMPYMGTSAGSNVAGISIGTSNDMPIVHPPSYESLSVVPFNLNPHYPSAKPDPTHKGETRDDRIREFHIFSAQPVIALYEDGMLRLEDKELRLVGQRPAFLFRQALEPFAVEPGVISPELFG